MELISKTVFLYGAEQQSRGSNRVDQVDENWDGSQLHHSKHGRPPDSNQKSRAQENQRKLQHAILKRSQKRGSLT